ncbi:MAG: DUF3179 domain-containing protein [Planctomycetes bacterium]|nr:DUF3179 domain-containing protein [Planctomycetota bacterium]
MRPFVSALALLSAAAQAGAQEPSTAPVLAKKGLYRQLTEPPCSYCATQDEKNLVRPDDRVVAWLRAKHQGGAIPLRHFLAAPRVINDTYGLFFYDPDGGYVSAFEKDYGYEFHGWRRGVMVVRGRDGTLFSALTGLAFEGPGKGTQLRRIPSLTTTWGHWLRLHPESTAYDLFDGQRYPLAELPQQPSAESLETMGQVDPRLPARAQVIGVRYGEETMAFPLENLPARACFQDSVGGASIAVFWYAPTQTAVAWRRVLDDRKLDFYADEISPPTAPWKDRETETRWTLAGRGIDGLLRGRELPWVDSVQCCWYAWVAEHPQTKLHTPSAEPAPKKTP